VGDFSTQRQFPTSERAAGRQPPKRVNARVTEGHRGSITGRSKGGISRHHAHSIRSTERDSVGFAGRKEHTAEFAERDKE